MHPLEHNISGYIHRHSLIPDAGTPVIVALSGGADSVALLAVLTSLGYKCVAAHCNFHLRGRESDRDEAHAREISSLFGAEFHLTHFDVSAHCRQAADSISVEMACRDLRYEWFEKLRTTLGAQSIAVAHHADDNTETMLLNLLRGCGITGVRGMLPHNDRHIIRPMLQCYRHEIEQYLHDRHIPFVTDSTNLESTYLRNRIRNIIMPCIRRQFPGADDAFRHSLDILSQNEAFYRQCIDEKRAIYTHPDSSIDLISLLDREPHAHLLLYEWLKQYGATSTQVDNIISSAHESGKRFNVTDGQLILDRGSIRYVKHTHESVPSSLDTLFEISIHDISEFQPGRDASVAYFDADALDISAVQVRTWQHGDSLLPFGMHGRRKLSDIFSDAKIPVDRKAAIPVVVYEGDIIWVAGVRASRLYAVTDQTKRFIKMRLRGQDKN